MAKNKKKITDFKDALLNNTKFIGKENEVSSNFDEVLESSPNNKIFRIDNNIAEQFEILAEFEKVSFKVQIDKALNHYLRLKRIKIEEAKESLKSG